MACTDRIWEARWPNGQSERPRIARSGLEPLPGTLNYALRTLLTSSHSASLHPGVQMGTGEFNAGSNPAMD